jgi:hypothetical protein
MIGAGLTVVIGWISNSQSPFNHAVYDQIKMGMTVEEVTKIIGMPPGLYKVSREEMFVNQGEEGMYAFGTKDYEEVETEPGIFDILHKETGVPAGGLRVWKNQEDGIMVIIQEDQVICKFYVRSITSFNRSLWWTKLRRRLGL